MHIEKVNEMREIKSRKDAIANKESYYFNGNPCCYGHIAKRQTLSGNCMECFNTRHRENRLKKMREWSKTGSGLMSRRSSRVDYRKRNRDAMEVAENSYQRWTVKDINLVTEKIGLGYKYTCMELSGMIGRSLKAVEKARKRYRDD